MSRRSWQRDPHAAGRRLGRPGGQIPHERDGAVKEGARGGTMGAPTIRDVRFLDV